MCSNNPAVGEHGLWTMAESTQVSSSKTVRKVLTLAEHIFIIQEVKSSDKQVGMCWFEKNNSIHDNKK